MAENGTVAPEASGEAEEQCSRRASSECQITVTIDYTLQT